MEIHCKCVLRMTIQLNAFQSVVSKLSLLSFFSFFLAEIKPAKGDVLRSESLCLFLLCHYCGRVLPGGCGFHRGVLWKEFMIKKI